MSRTEEVKEELEMSYEYGCNASSVLSQISITLAMIYDLMAEQDSRTPFDNALRGIVPTDNKEKFGEVGE